MEEINMKNHKRDLILIGILLLTALILFLLFKDKQRNEPDAVAVVTVDGTEIASVSGTTVTLDLNGKTLDRGLAVCKEKGSVILDEKERRGR